MSKNLAGWSLVLAVAALGLAGYVLWQERPDPFGFGTRLDEIDERIARVERALERRSGDRPEEPSLSGVRHEVDRALDLLTVDEAEPGAAGSSESSDGALSAPSPAGGEGATEEIRTLVEEAVEKKAAQMIRMRDKKPGIDAFAQTIELTEAQRKAAEETIVRAQHEIFRLLDVPAADGTNFMEEVVDIVAQGMAKPGQDPGRFGKLFARLMAEKVPGTDETYAVRIESVKQRVRDSFKRDWTDRQYATFEAWQMDPTEVRGIEGSPRPELERRVRERARALGAQIPEPDDR